MCGTHFKSNIHAMKFAAKNCSKKKQKKFDEQVESFAFVGVIIMKFQQTVHIYKGFNC